MAKLDLIVIVAWAIDQKVIAVKLSIAIRNKKSYIVFLALVATIRYYVSLCL